MSELYAIAKGAKLKLKGEKKPPKTKKRKHTGSSKSADNDPEIQRLREDTAAHGGWRAVRNFAEISGIIALEFGNQVYVKSLDDGTFNLGVPHKPTEPPAPEEIFTAIKINEDKIALKSGYGKYLKVEKDGEIVGKSDAIGPTEQWEPIFEEGKLALLGSNGCFMSPKSDDDALVATSKKAGPEQFVKLRCQIQEHNPEDDIPTVEKGNIADIELNYVKKFQKFQDKRIRLNKDSREDVKKAKEAGTLHETLLDRRAKMKADRYCK